MKITTLIVQARMESTRLKGKSIMLLAGKPLIYRIMERLTRCKEIDHLVLAIPNTKANDIISKIKFIGNVKIYRGSQCNLLKRYYLAAKKYRSDIVVRVPGDNCMPEPYEIDKIIKFYKKFKKPFFASNLSNILNNGYPDGIGAEVFSFSFLEYLMKKKLTSKFKEHIHLNFFDYKKNKPMNNKWCKVRTIKCPNKISRPNISLDVNTLKDYKFVKKIYNVLYKKNKKFTIRDIIRYLDKNYEN